MTIKVTIRNDDDKRGIIVTEIEHSKSQNDARSKKTVATPILPGGQNSFYVHLLRDLIVEEQQP